MKRFRADSGTFELFCHPAGGVLGASEHDGARHGLVTQQTLQHLLLFRVADVHDTLVDLLHGDLLWRDVDARRLIDSCQILALASLLETQPLVITEAMASGLPVVATAIYGIPEIVENGVTGSLVPPEEVEPLAKALAELIGDAAGRERMGAAARRRYEERFTLEIMASRTYQALQGEGAA